MILNTLSSWCRSEFFIVWKCLPCSNLRKSGSLLHPAPLSFSAESLSSALLLADYYRYYYCHWNITIVASYHHLHHYRYYFHQPIFSSNKLYMICNLRMSLHDNSHSVASIAVTLLDRAILKQPNCFFFVRFLLKELNKNKKPSNLLFNNKKRDLVPSVNCTKSKAKVTILVNYQHSDIKCFSN